MKTNTAVKWYFSKEAKRGRVGHLAGHARLGASFSKCGKALGRECSRGFFDPCAACGIEQNKEAEREKKRVAMEASAPKVEMPKTPELDKMAAVKEKSQIVGEFIDWLKSTRGAHLALTHKHGPTCEGWDDGRGRYNPGDGEQCFAYDGESVPMRYTIEELLAEFFEIDLKKVESERRAILDAIRSKG